MVGLSKNLADTLYSRFGKKRTPTISAVMFHMGRCGSTVLSEMLRANSKITWADELFLREEGGPEKAKGISYAERKILRHRNTSRGDVFGFEIKYQELTQLSEDGINVPLPSFVNLMAELEFNRYVVLHRRNYLKRTISAAYGHSEGFWNKTSVPVREPIVLDVERIKIMCSHRPLLWHFAMMDRRKDELNALLNQKTVLQLYYEDDIEKDVSVAYDKVCSFFGVAAEATRPTLRKLNSRSVRESIANFEDIENALRRTPYEWMLDT